VNIPLDISKLPTVVQSVIRNKVTFAAIFSVMHDIFTAVDGESTKLNLVYATAQRYRTETAQEVSEQIAAT